MVQASRQASHYIDYSIPAMRKWYKLPENIRAEVIDGTLYKLTPPKRSHAEVIIRIIITLGRYILENRLGSFYTSSFGVFLINGSNVVIPDLIFVSKENEERIDERGIHGPPDLLIEVLSPSNRKHDLVRKKALYENAGVKEYWIIDPKTKDAMGYLLHDDKYNDPLLLNSELNIRILNKTIKF